MRLIDGDELLEILRIMQEVYFDRKIILGKVVEEVKRMPTIEPERKPGKWLPLQVSMVHPPYQCSCCFKNAPMVETGCLLNRYLEALLTDYCPNCGADMRGGQE